MNERRHHVQKRGHSMPCFSTTVLLFSGLAGITITLQKRRRTTPTPNTKQTKKIPTKQAGGGIYPNQTHPPTHQPTPTHPPTPPQPTPPNHATPDITPPTTLQHTTLHLNSYQTEKKTSRKKFQVRFPRKRGGSAKGVIPVITRATPPPPTPPCIPTHTHLPLTRPSRPAVVAMPKSASSTLEGP